MISQGDRRTTSRRLAAGAGVMPLTKRGASYWAGLMLATGLLWSTPAWAGWPSNADVIGQTLVFGEVHPWEGNPGTDGSYIRWNDTGHNPYINDIMSTFWPTQGAYSAGDCTTVASQGSDLQRAGVDVAVIDWVNVYPNEQGRMEVMLSCLWNNGNGVKAVIQVDVEPGWASPTFAETIARLETVIGWYSRYNSNYYRAPGTTPGTNWPVYLVWDPAAVGSIADWNTKIDWYKANTPEHGIFIAGLGANTSIDWCAQSRFDGCLALPAKTSSSDQGTYEWAMWRIHAAGSYSQFFVGGVIPGFDSTANCFNFDPVVDRQSGAVFDNKWSGVNNATWTAYKVNHAYVGYHNDGEGAGIEPVSSAPPVRDSGYESCSGRVSPYYTTYSPLAPTYYLDRNAYWSSQFKISR